MLFYKNLNINISIIGFKVSKDVKFVKLSNIMLYDIFILWLIFMIMLIYIIFKESLIFK